MRHIITSSPAEVGAVAALTVLEKVKQLRRASHTVGIRLATGSSPRPLYRELILAHRTRGVTFSDIWFSSLDAYVGPKRGEPCSYPDELWDQLLRHIDCDPSKVRLTDAPTVDPDELLALIRRYEEQLRSPSRKEIALLGIGHDGHIAFIMPGSPPGRLRMEGFGIEQLSETTRAKNSRFVNGEVGAVPHHALTILGGSLCRMELNLLMAFGADKADAIYRLWTEPVSEACPATILREAPHTVIITDDAAASRVKPLFSPS